MYQKRYQGHFWSVWKANSIIWKQIPLSKIMIIKETPRIQYVGIENTPMIIVETIHDDNGRTFTLKKAYTQEEWDRYLKNKNKKSIKIKFS